MNSDSVYIHSTMQEPRHAHEDAYADLARRAKAGEEAAFTELYTSLHPRVYRFIFYRVSHKEVAEDLAEDVFLKAYRNMNSLGSNGSVSGWIFQIARNSIIDYYRAKKITVPLEEIEHTVAYEANLLDLAHLQSQQAILLRLLKELEPQQQTVLKLKFFEDLDNSEIAGMLQKTEGAIRVIQHRAISKLKELIATQQLQS